MHRCQRFLDKFRYAIVHAQPRPQTLYPARTRFFQVGDGIKRLLQRAIVTARRRLLTEPHERRAQQSLQLRILFGAHLLANLPQRILQSFTRRLTEEFRELAQADRRFLARLRVFVLHAGGVVQQNIASRIRFAAAHQIFHVLLNVARRYAPRFRRHQNRSFPGVRYRRPELAVEHVGVGFDHHPGRGHFFFARFQ